MRLPDSRENLYLLVRARAYSRAYLSMYYKETWAWNTHPSKSHGVAPWKLTAGNTKGRLTSERDTEINSLCGLRYILRCTCVCVCVCVCVGRERSDTVCVCNRVSALPPCIRGWMVRWLDSVHSGLNTGREQPASETFASTNRCFQCSPRENQQFFG